MPEKSRKSVIAKVWDLLLGRKPQAVEDSSPNILYVAVSRDQQGQVEIDPDPTLLDPTVDDVVWWLVGYPEGDTLQIDFAEGDGPFPLLQHQGQLVIGSGNSGVAGDFPYQARIVSLSQGTIVSGAGMVVNQQGFERNRPRPIVCDKNPPGPPSCHDLVHQ